jgi:ribosomal protein S18 acetylase RimI-like enzyme
LSTTIDIFVGKETAKYIDIVSEWRIKLFREYPYLYVGDIEYEKKYMQGHATDKQAMIAIAKVDGMLAGFSTGFPLISDSEIVADVKKLVSQAGDDIADYYYYGEIMVLPEFRGRGLASMLYTAQDNLIKSWEFKHVCISTVVQEENHPLKPAGYKSTEGMFEHMGFVKNKLMINYPWPTIQHDQSIKEVNHQLACWTKSLME